MNARQYQAILNQLTDTIDRIIPEPDARYDKDLHPTLEHLTNARRELVHYLEGEGYTVKFVGTPGGRWRVTD